MVFYYQHVLRYVLDLYLKPPTNGQLLTTVALTTANFARQFYLGRSPIANRAVRYRRGFDTDLFAMGGFFDNFFMPSSGERDDTVATPFGNLQWATYD